MTQCTEINSQLNSISGQNYDYYGETDNKGQKEGFGIQNWKDESKFKGNFIKNKAKGWGIFRYSKGDIYKGED